MAFIADPWVVTHNEPTRYILSDKHRDFLKWALKEEKYPYHKYRGYIMEIMKRGYYVESTKKQLNEFRRIYIRDYYSK